jgi:hypothetical protein
MGVAVEGAIVLPCRGDVAADGAAGDGTTSAACTLEALLLVGSAIQCSDSGFLELETASELVAHVFHIQDCKCAWLSRKHLMLSKLMKYLPIISVKLDGAVSGKSTSFNISARPPEGNCMLQQVATLAAIANSASSQTQTALRSLPMKAFLQVMETERDRRVFKGVIAAVTNPTFVRSAFNWHSGSIANISEELGLVDYYLADLHKMMQSVDYCNATSTAVRKRMRREALLRLNLNGFLGERRGGRPSLIEQYS